MSRKWKVAILAGIVVLGLTLLLVTNPGKQLQFLIGGGMINLGYRMQDHLENFDFVRRDEISPENIWNEMFEQNRLAASMRKNFPRTARHPLVEIVACMDARIDTNELTGDTRKFYYIIRTAGSLLSEEEMEMLELAIANGVKLVVLTTHSDCAAEKAAANPQMRERFPALTQAVNQRDHRFRELLERPIFVKGIAAGTLVVKIINIDTMTAKMVPLNGQHGALGVPLAAEAP